MRVICHRLGQVLEQAPQSRVWKVSRSQPGHPQHSRQPRKGADVVSVAGGSDRTPVSRDKLQPQEGSLVCWDSELELHSVGNEPPVESFK